MSNLVSHVYPIIHFWESRIGYVFLRDIEYLRDSGTSQTVLSSLILNVDLGISLILLHVFV